MKAANDVTEAPRPWLVTVIGVRIEQARGAQERRDYRVVAPDRKWAELLARSSALASGLCDTRIVAAGPSL